MTPAADSVRLDKWLWAARLFKTRSRAAVAIRGGKVEVGGARAKPAREIRVGDEVQVTIGQGVRTLVVAAISEHRGPAVQAEGLYRETDASRERRERLAAERRFGATPGADLPGRPTKRDRRRIEAMRRGRRPG